MSVPVFLDIDESEQVTEIRSYLKSLGAEISEEASQDALVLDLSQIVEASDIIWKEEKSEADAESVMNSLISLILLVPSEKVEGVILTLCEKLCKTQDDKSIGARFRILNNMFQGLDARCSLRYNVYLSMVKLAGKSDYIHHINVNMDEIKKWMVQWETTPNKMQNLLRNLHEAFIECHQIEKATKVMIELLGTYTEENASQARDDAQRCIVTCLSDPSTYLMDHLLTLKPVKFLEGEPIHDLLTIFVSGKLEQYMQFYNTHRDFINTIGLSHEANMHKMRMLTFMQMAETHKEISFETIEREMGIEADDVETFIIDVVRTKAVCAKMDQLERKVIISSTTHRTFGKQQWQQLRENLVFWHSNMDQILTSLASLEPPPKV